MTDADRYLDTFPTWLHSLGQDAALLSDLLASGAPAQTEQAVAGGLNYLFKSLDLIPDGIDDIGFLDDAFVLRVAADMAMRDSLESLDEKTIAAVTRLADECDVIREFLAADYDRLETYVKGLGSGSARGRSVPEILGSPDVRQEFVSDVQGFASSYDAPTFSRDAKNLVKLKAFLDAKLPRRRDSVRPA